MAKIIFGPTISSARGKVGDSQFTRSRGGNVVRAKRLTAPMSGLANQVFRIPAAGGTPAFGAVDLTKSAAVSGPLPVSFGGTGTATPALVPGANIDISGSWPAHTVALKSPITGNFILGDGTGEHDIFINGGAGHYRWLLWQTGGLLRWGIATNETAESGGNAGSNFYIASFDDAGLWLHTPICIRRSDGQVGMGTTDPKSALHVVGIPVYANNAAAIAGGLTAGAFYRTGADPDPVCVVH